MKNLFKLSLTLIILLLNFSLFAQDPDEARLKTQDAIKLMDAGEIDESLELLNEAKKLAPKSYTIQYEIAYAYYLKKDYKKVIKLLEKLKSHKDVSVRLYQLLGNSYDLKGKPNKAISKYEEGLEMFPNSGVMYLEIGNVNWLQKKYNEALNYYEHGIKVDPTFSSNYFRAAIVYTMTDEKLWAMIYGELFMNLERNSKRTSTMSKLLFDTYVKNIEFTTDTSYQVSFSKNATINVSVDDLEAGLSDFKLPYGVGAYEPTLLLSIVGEKELTLKSLSNIRTNFVSHYYALNHDSTYPNVLFDYQKQIIDSGHIEAYNHWILMKGDEEEFIEWKENNNEKWEAFIKWFTRNKIVINEVRNFHSGQY